MGSVGKRALRVLIAAALLGCDSAQPLFGPREVDVTRARIRTVPELVDYPARIEAPARVDVTARTEGYLLERTFEDGTEVEQDRALFVLQPDAYDAAVEKAEAEREEAEAKLALAEKEVERLSGTRRDGEKLERAELEREAAAAATRASRAAVEQARLEASYTILRAPISGRIERHPIDVGNVVSVGDQLATIVQLDPIYVSFDVDPDDLPTLRAAQDEAPILVQVVTSEGRVHARTGRVQAIGGEIQAGTPKVAVRAVVPNPRIDLVAGQTVTARLLLRWHVDAVVVPERAVREAAGETFVWVVDGEDRVERRRVVAGPIHAGERVVHEGLHEGERVVVGRARAAVAGRRVRAVQKETTPVATPALAPRVSPPAKTASPSAAPSPESPQPTSAPTGPDATAADGEP